MKMKIFVKTEVCSTYLLVLFCPLFSDPVKEIQDVICIGDKR